MRTSKSEVAYFILSIIMIAVALGIYILFGDQNTVKTTDVEPKSSLQTSSSGSSDGEKLVQRATQLVKKYEDSFDESMKSSVQDAIKAIPQSHQSDKDSLQKKFDSISTDITNQKTANDAISQANAARTSFSVEQAQAAIDAVSNATKKAELQAQLAPIKAAVDAAVASTSSVVTTPTESETTSNQVSDYTTITTEE